MTEFRSKLQPVIVITQEGRLITNLQRKRAALFYAQTWTNHNRVYDITYARHERVQLIYAQILTNHNRDRVFTITNARHERAQLIYAQILTN